MTRGLAMITATLGAVLGAACAGHTHYDPFIVPQERIYGSVKTIALDAVCPCGVPKAVGNVDPSRGRFDSLLTAELRTAGFAVVPWVESRAIWQRVTDSLGGLFNQTTGERDTVKFTIARGLTMQELAMRFHADAWLHPLIVLATAKFDGGEAEWEGTTQSYQSLGKKFLAVLFGGGTSGKTPALSVRVHLEDVHGKDLYANQGGLQLYEVPSGRDFVPIPPGQLYADPARNADAVHLALAPLVTRTISGGSSHETPRR